MQQDAQPLRPFPGSSDAVADNGPPVAARKARPKKTLPTSRIAFNKQLDILRAHAVLSHEGEKPATNTAVAEMVKMNASTISLANPFFADVGLLVKSNGSYLPSREVIEYSRATQWEDAKAAHKLAPLIRDSWFGRAILRSLAFNTSMEEEAAIRQLAQEASAGTEYRGQIAMLLTYMDAAGLVERDGSLLRPGVGGPGPAQEQPAPEPAPQPMQAQGRAPAGASTDVPQGGVRFEVSVQVDMAELQSWEPARITAFFSGLAAVLAAKGGIE